jgi:hypothetical protein
MPYCADATDANDDGTINISDPIATLSWLFLVAAPLPAPSPAGGGGFDGTADDLFCVE